MAKALSSTQAQAVTPELKLDIPRHLGIILDGNRRWAKRKGLNVFQGHLRGLIRVETIVREAFKIGVEFVSLFVFSTENWKRTKDEVNYLMDLCLRFFIKDSERLLKDGFRLKIAGRLDEDLSPEICKAIRDIEKKSAKNKGPTVIICFNYGGQVEILDMVKQIVQKQISLDKINLDTLHSALYHPEIPGLDLVIRTSGEQRLSGFQLWRAAYAEIFFVDKMWPEFTVKDLRQIIREYQKRNRRFGGN